MVDGERRCRARFRRSGDKPLKAGDFRPSSMFSNFCVWMEDGNARGMKRAATKVSVLAVFET